jgi:hypothetical protein
MRSFMNLAVLALAASTISPALSAPTQYRYRNLLVGFEGRSLPMNPYTASGRPQLRVDTDVSQHPNSGSPNYHTPPTSVTPDYRTPLTSVNSGSPDYYTPPNSDIPTASGSSFTASTSIDSSPEISPTGSSYYSTAPSSAHPHGAPIVPDPDTALALAPAHVDK